MNSEKVLQVKNLTTKLRVKGKATNVVTNASFDLVKGKTSALVGESGCGKSMLALSIMRILPSILALPPEGQATYKDQDLLSLPERKMRDIRGSAVAMIFQDPMSALNPVYTIGDQLFEVVDLHLHLSYQEAFDVILQTLKDVEMPNPESCMGKYPHELSGGMQQRAMIAMALICKPDILIADEPTTALDVTIQKQVLKLISGLQKKYGMAVLLITHDMGIVAEIADEVMVMYATEIIERGEVHEIFSNMAHPYTKGLFKSRPHIKPPTKSVAGELYSIRGSVPGIDRLPFGCHFHPRCDFAKPECQQKKPQKCILSKSHSVSCVLYGEK